MFTKIRNCLHSSRCIGPHIQPQPLPHLRTLDQQDAAECVMDILVAALGLGKYPFQSQRSESSCPAPTDLAVADIPSAPPQPALTLHPSLSPDIVASLCAAFPTSRISSSTSSSSSTSVPALPPALTTHSNASAPCAAAPPAQTLESTSESSSSSPISPPSPSVLIQALALVRSCASRCAQEAYRMCAYVCVVHIDSANSHMPSRRLAPINSAIRGPS